MAVQTGPRLRPLLGLRRATTRQACTELGLPVWDDPHNVDDRFTRSRIRRRVLPLLEEQLGPGIAEALARTAQLARADNAVLDALADELIDRARLDDDLDCAALEKADEAVRTRVLKAWLTSSGATETAYERVRAVDALVTHWHGQREVQLPGLAVRRRDGRLVARPH
jgi:tRNA(Ile)-lysidine synthase